MISDALLQRFVDICALYRAQRVAGFFMPNWPMEIFGKIEDAALDRLIAADPNLSQQGLDALDFLRRFSGTDMAWFGQFLERLEENHDRLARLALLAYYVEVAAIFARMAFDAGMQRALGSVAAGDWKELLKGLYDPPEPQTAGRN
jgi:hypothetical protein